MAQLRSSARLAAAAAEQPPAKKAKTEAPKPAKQESSPKSAPAAPEKKASAEKPAKSSELEVGDDIPDLVLKNEHDEDVDLRKLAAKTKYLVIFAYPKASTPGCTRQACGFQKNHKELAALDAAVVGLSADSPKSQLNFVTKQHLEYPLLSDPQRTLIDALGAKKSPSGIKRSHWIFADGKLKVKKIQISPEVSINSALEDVKEFEKKKK